MMDASSKWLDAHIMSSMSSEKTIETLRSVFATHGLLQMIVTDNGPSFTSNEFREFTQKKWYHARNFSAIPSIKKWSS